MKLRNIITGLALLAAVSVSAQYDLNAAAEEYKTEVEASIKKMNGNDKHNSGPSHSRNSSPNSPPTKTS